MSKKTFKLVTACIGGADAIAVAIVSFCCEAATAAAVNAAIAVACTAAIEICNIFTKED